MPLRQGVGVMGLVAQTEVNDAVWRLTTHWTWAPWATALFAMAAIALVAACYRWELSPAGSAYRATLGVLRGITLLLLLAMLSEAVFSGSRFGKPRLTVLADVSGSMNRTDAADPSLEASEPIARVDAVRRLLAEDDGELLRRLGETYEIDLQGIDANVTRFAATPRKQTNATDAAVDAAALSGEDPSATRLGDAIADAVGGGQAPPQAVLVLTDGQATAGRSLAEGADAARAAATPLYLVGVGSPNAPAEAWLADLVADETAFVDDLVTFEATLSSRGLQPEDGAITVELLRSGADGPVATARMTPGVDGSAAVRLVDRPTAPGEYRYTLRIAEGPAPTDRAARPPLTHKLRVRDDAIRVLLAAGYPNYEYRYLKHLLERDESIRVATHLQDADPEYSAADLTALPGVPTTEEGLAEFDVLVLIDLDPTLLPRSLWKRVGDFVSERGGGVVLVAGPRSLPVAYRTRA
ncbi:MAG: hypothetical protein AAF805_09035, partial [Planctomycetota bacterium]